MSGLKHHFIFVATILILAAVVSTVMIYFGADGDKGWWPVSLIIGIVISLAYAQLFALAATHWDFKTFPSGYVHIVVAMLSVVNTTLFYHLPVDWLAVNSGAELHWFIQLVHSDLTHYLLYVTGLSVSLLIGYVFSRTQGTG